MSLAPPPIDALALRPTPAHALEPRIKLVLTVVACAALATAPRIGPAGAGLLCLPTVAALALGRVPLAALRRAAFTTAPFWGLLVLPAPFLEPGTAIAETHLLGATLTMTREGLLLGATLLLKFVGAVATVLALVASTPFAQITGALARLRVPSALVVVLGLTWRYLFLLRDEGGRMLRARRARGGGRRPRVGEAAGLLGTLLLRSLERAERVHRAMRARGFDGALPVLGERALRPSDLLVGASFIAVMVGLWLAARLLSSGGLS